MVFVYCNCCDCFFDFDFFVGYDCFDCGELCVGCNVFNLGDFILDIFVDLGCFLCNDCFDEICEVNLVGYLVVLF